MPCPGQRRPGRRWERPQGEIRGVKFERVAERECSSLAPEARWAATLHGLAGGRPPGPLTHRSVILHCPMQDRQAIAVKPGNAQTWDQPHLF